MKHSSAQNGFLFLNQFVDFLHNPIVLHQVHYVYTVQSSSANPDAFIQQIGHVWL